MGLILLEVDADRTGRPATELLSSPCSWERVCESTAEGLIEGGFMIEPCVQRSPFLLSPKKRGRSLWYLLIAKATLERLVVGLALPGKAVGHHH